MDGQRKRFHETECTPGEDSVRTAEMTTEDYEYHINLVEKAAAGVERTDSNSERSSTRGKMLPNSITCNRETVHERKTELMQPSSLLSYVEKVPQQCLGGSAG